VSVPVSVEATPSGLICRTRSVVPSYHVHGPVRTSHDLPARRGRPRRGGPSRLGTPQPVLGGPRHHCPRGLNEAEARDGRGQDRSADAGADADCGRLPGSRTQHQARLAGAAGDGQPRRRAVGLSSVRPSRSRRCPTPLTGLRGERWRCGRQSWGRGRRWRSAPPRPCRRRRRPPAALDCAVSSVNALYARPATAASTPTMITVTMSSTRVKPRRQVCWWIGGTVGSGDGAAPADRTSVTVRGPLGSRPQGRWGHADVLLGAHRTRMGSSCARRCDPSAAWDRLTVGPWGRRWRIWNGAAGRAAVSRPLSTSRR
jgi:hypothetical protein